MIKPVLILNICILFSCSTFPQSKTDFHSPSNIKLFADYLFCQKDYLRAYNEYKKYLEKAYNDSVEFKAGLSLQQTGYYDDALSQFDRIPVHSPFYIDAKKEYARTLFLKKDFSSLNDFFLRSDSLASYFPFIKKLDEFACFYDNDPLPQRELFVSSFPVKERKYITNFYEWKGGPPYKSPLLAGVLSTVIPGLGKVYTKNYSDAFFAALLTGIFGYIAYTDFKADHNLRAWIFTGTAAFFYTGNIYGSAASAQIYNAKIRFEFETELNDFLDVFHYLSGDFNFCK